MTTQWSKPFLEQLKAGWDPAGETVTMYLFPQAPTLDETKTFSYTSVDSLVPLLGWGPYIGGPSIELSGNITGDPRYAFVEEEFDLLGGFPPTMIKAVALCVDGTQLMYVTDTPFPGPGLVLHDEDGFIPAVDTGVSEMVLFSWRPVPVSAPPTTLPVVHDGTLLLRYGPPDFEAARTQHVWVYPQRMNLIANPSFELGTDYWRSNGTLAQIGATPFGGGTKAGRVTPSGPVTPESPKLVLESNLFPLNYGRRTEMGLTIQMQVGGTGSLRIGLVAWDNSFTETYTDWGPEDPLVLSGTGYTHVKVIRMRGEVHTGLLRLELDGTVLDIDQVCVEPGVLPPNGVDWPYFDGDSQFGIPGDFSWYGGPSRHHASYSCWYNNCDATFGRMFSWKVTKADEPPEGVFSDVDVMAQGLVYQWVPAGTPVVAHLGVLYAGDPVSEIPPVVGSVLPYSTDTTDGVFDPW